MDKALVRALNDILRNTFTGGVVCMSHAVASLPESLRHRVLQEVREFVDFSEDNDPYEEHDFGSVTVSKEKYFWKIDYYDKNMEYHSPDPSNRRETTRVLTIMHSSEY